MNEPFVQPLRDFQVVLGMSQRQYDTVVAAMRFYQHGLDTKAARAEQCRDEIAAFSGPPLTADEIDDLVQTQ